MKFPYKYKGVPCRVVKYKEYREYGGTAPDDYLAYIVFDGMYEAGAIRPIKYSALGMGIEGLKRLGLDPKDIEMQPLYDRMRELYYE